MTPDSPTRPATRMRPAGNTLGPPAGIRAYSGAVSNLERDPAEFVQSSTQAPTATAVQEAGIERLLPRLVPLGGPRALTVRRTLPQRARSTIGAWCFVDHFGPDVVTPDTGMVVPPHPHTGLQTVSWLFAGGVEHRDSVGSHSIVRPNELNLMTAGRGISHSEVSTQATRALHGVQLWLALPEEHRHRAPRFEHHRIPEVRFGAATLRVFIGELVGATSPARVFSPLVGAQIDLPHGCEVELPVDAGFEHGVLVDTGTVRIGGDALAPGELGYLPAGRDGIRIENTSDEPARVLLLGGRTFGEPLVMWWNFVGRSHDEIAAWRAHWQSEVIEGRDAGGRFGSVGGYPGAALPAPVLPTVRLKPRD